MNLSHIDRRQMLAESMTSEWYPPTDFIKGLVWDQSYTYGHEWPEQMPNEVCY